MVSGIRKLSCLTSSSESSKSLCLYKLSCSHFCVCCLDQERFSTFSFKQEKWIETASVRDKRHKNKRNIKFNQKDSLPFLAHSHTEFDCMVERTLMIKTNYKLTYLFSVSLAWQICGCGTCGHLSFVSDKQEWKPALLTTSKSWVPFSKFTKQIMIKSQWTATRPKDKVYTHFLKQSLHTNILINHTSPFH